MTRYRIIICKVTVFLQELDLKEAVVSPALPCLEIRGELSDNADLGVLCIGHFDPVLVLRAALKSLYSQISSLIQIYSFTLTSSRKMER